MIAGAGALGCCLRYAAISWGPLRHGTVVPMGTLLVNVAGSFLVAFVAGLATDKVPLSDDARVAVTVGFLGGLTTYSGFALETSLLARQGAWTAALANFGITTVACFVAVGVGLYAGAALRVRGMHP